MFNPCRVFIVFVCLHINILMLCKTILWQITFLLSESMCKSIWFQNSQMTPYHHTLLWCHFMCRFIFRFVRGGTKSCSVHHPEWNLGVRLCQPIHRVLSGDLGQRSDPAYRDPGAGTVTVSGHARAGKQPNATGTAAQWVLNIPTHAWSLECSIHSEQIGLRFFFCYYLNWHFNDEQIALSDLLCFGLIQQSACVFLCLAAIAAEELDFERFHSVLQ